MSLTLKQARGKPLDVFLRVRRGDDPASDRRKSYDAAMVADRHIEEHAKLRNRQKSVQRDRRAWDRCVLSVLSRRGVP